MCENYQWKLCLKVALLMAEIYWRTSWAVNPTRKHSSGARALPSSWSKTRHLHCPPIRPSATAFDLEIANIDCTSQRWKVLETCLWYAEIQNSMDGVLFICPYSKIFWNEDTLPLETSYFSNSGSQSRFILVLIARQCTVRRRRELQPHNWHVRALIIE